MTDTRSSPGTAALLPCPFCGEKQISLNEPSQSYRYGSINCPACLVCMPGEVRNTDELIGCWNDRASTSDAAQPPRTPLDLSAGELNTLATDAFREAAQRQPEPEDWREDPSADERWNLGLDFGMNLLCDYLGVDKNEVMWDAATETVEGDVSAVLGNILKAKFGEDWSPTAVTPSPVAGEEIGHPLERLWKAIEASTTDASFWMAEILLNEITKETGYGGPTVPSTVETTRNQARSSERETILAMLVNATKQRDCFHVGGVTMKNSAGNDLFIDSARIDAVIDAIRARRIHDPVGTPLGPEGGK